MPLFKLPKTPQEVYDIVKLHLLSQNKVCAKGLLCRYSYNGLKCAAGVLIPAEHYDPAFESITWGELVSEEDFPPEHSQLICELQGVHDMYTPEKWEEKLKKVAVFFGLKG